MRDGFETKKLGDFCTLDRSHSKGKSLPYVGLEDIVSGKGQFTGSIEPKKVQSSTFRFTSDHVLYGRLRPYLNKVFLPNFEGHCSTEIFPILPAPNVDRRYLYYWLSTEATVKKIDRTSTGARMPRANMDAVLELPISMPHLSEQQRIVAILDETFAGLATATANAEKNLTNARELFESYRESIFDTRGEGWTECPLGELVEIKHGFAFESKYFRPEGDYVLLTPGNFFEEGGYRDRGEKQKYYVGEIPDGFILKKDDFLIAMTEQAAGLLGSSIIVPEDDRFLHNQRLGLVQLKPGAPWSNDFFFHAFNTRRFRREAHDSASGVKVRHTSPTKLGNITIGFPKSRDKQDKVAMQLTDLLGETERLAEKYELKLSLISELKQAILQRAFSGELTSLPSEAINEAAE